MITRRFSPIFVAWTATLLASSLGIILWREFAGGEPYWLAWVHASGLAAIFILTLARADLKPLRGFVLILLVIFLFGFGGGWQFGLIPFVRSSVAWTAWESQVPWALSAVVYHLIRLIPAMVLLSFLLLKGRKR